MNTSYLYLFEASMPIYEYTCLECENVIGILQKDSSSPPTRCGIRCPLPAHDQRGIRGFGVLKRCLSSFSGQFGSHLRDKPTIDEVQKAGFAIYENKGEGVIKKVSGKGPEIIDTNNTPK